MSKKSIASLLQVVGAVSLTIAGFVIGGAGAGFIVLGVLAIVFGIALEREVGPVVLADAGPSGGG